VFKASGTTQSVCFEALDGRRGKIGVDRSLRDTRNGDVINLAILGHLLEICRGDVGGIHAIPGKSPNLHKQNEKEEEKKRRERSKKVDLK